MCDEEAVSSKISQYKQALEKLGGAQGVGLHPASSSIDREAVMRIVEEHLEQSLLKQLPDDEERKHVIASLKQEARMAMEAHLQKDVSHKGETS